MKKFISLLGATVMTAAVALTMAGCQHTHVWGSWQRSETEHWRECTVSGCKAEERATHAGIPCVCGMNLRVLSFGFDSGGDTAHSDFASEANVWFTQKGKELGFTYEFASTDYSKLNDENLENYDLVMFLNDRPHIQEAKEALEKFMKDGGAWMGFHACAFSMEGNNEHWDWYQDEFLGCGDYAKNTWHPTSEPLTVRDYNHCATENLVLEDDWFLSAPCEWYGWKSDLFGNDDISVLLTLDPTEDNPAGDDHRPGMDYQIWTSGSYPIAWANKNYNMVYMNWGHNLQSYNSTKDNNNYPTEGTSSSTFCREEQNKFMLDAMFGLVANKYNK